MGQCTETCRTCHSSRTTQGFTGLVLEKKIQYYECKKCGYVQTESPTWLTEAYKSPINISDTGIVHRNNNNIKLVLATLSALKSRKAIVVDCAGGHGLLVRMLRDIGINAFWSDPFTENILARGFEYKHDPSDYIGLVTAFEALEHFVDPQEEVKNLLNISTNILFTTTLIPRPTPNPSDWWYYGLEHGQHIGFFRVETLHYLARLFNCQLLTDGHSVHLFTRSRVSSRKWRFFMRLSRAYQRTFTFGLQSLTWQDHLAMASQ